MEYTLDTVINYIQQYFFALSFHLQFDGEKKISQTKIVQKDYENKLIQKKARKKNEKLSKFHENTLKN